MWNFCTIRLVEAIITLYLYHRVHKTKNGVNILQVESSIIDRVAYAYVPTPLSASASGSPPTAHLMRLETDAVENENCVHRAKRSVVKLVLFHAYAKTFWSNRQQQLVGPLSNCRICVSLSSRDILQRLHIRLMQ